MKVELDRSLELPVPAAAGWALISDIEGIATCMPGAKITERVDDTHYKGTISVKLGPATVNFRGELEVLETDPAARSIRIRGKASDVTGGSGASLNLDARVVETGPGACELTGHSEVTVTGKVAAFGQRLMGSVTEQLLKVLFANILTRAEQVTAAAPGTAATETPAPAAAAPQAEAKFNALQFAWAVLRDFVRGLFVRSKAT